MTRDLVEIPSNGPTMSSREIADLTGSTHDNVLKTVRALVAKGVVFGNETPYVHPQNGQTYSEFLLNYRDTMVVVSGYSVELRARIIDRWQELESGVAKYAAPQIMPIQVEALKLMPIAMRAARCIGLDKNAAAISASQALVKMTGVNVLALLGATHLEAERQVQFFTPTELGSRMGLSGRKFNMLLAEAGLQAKHNDTWVALDTARDFVRLFDTGKKHGDGTPVTQMKWAENVLNLVQPVAA